MANRDEVICLWRIEMLGVFRARSGETVVDRFQTQKTGALFAYLAYFADRSHLREDLGTLLWPDGEPGAVRKRLSQALVSLRPQFELDSAAKGRVFVADRWSVGLSPDFFRSDVDEFRRAIASAENATEPAARIPLLQQAVALYLGDLLPGFYDDWVLTERLRLLDHFLFALRQIITHFERSGQLDLALGYARRAVATNVSDEESHHDLIRLLAASGQNAAALRHAREWERTLEKETGEPPSEVIRALIDSIRRSNAPAAALPTTRSHFSAAVPVALTQFFGRQAEIDRVETMVIEGSARLITLTGTGGAGKTRLSIEIARRLAHRFSDALIFLSLADLSEIELVIKALADHFGILPSAASPLTEIVKALAARPFLIILDNAEHLVAHVALLVRDLLQFAPSLTILVTSRQRLALDWEREIPVPALSAPADSFLAAAGRIDLHQLNQQDSVRMFVDRAQAVKPAFQVTAQNAVTIAHLCNRLEGIPLAIELCAAWAQTLSPGQMLSKLAHRFDLLVSRRSDIPPRHRTLRAALEYSYLMLPSDLQQFFIRMSVFCGGWTLDAAEALWADQPTENRPFAVLTHLDELREHSLIVAEEIGTADTDAGMRYRMLETLREFAKEQRTIAMEAAIASLHSEYFLGFVEAVELHDSGPDQRIWLVRLEAEHDNLRAALAWALEQEAVETGFRLAVALTPFWEVRGHMREGSEWLRQFLALHLSSELSHGLQLRAKALHALAHLIRESDFQAATVAALESLELWRAVEDAHGTAACLVTLGTLAYTRVDDEQAQAYLFEGLGLARQAQDRPIAAGALLNLGVIAMNQEKWEEAWILTSECLTLLRADNHRKRIADALNNLGLIARYQTNFSAARTLLLENLAIRRELSDRSGAAIALLNLATVNRLEGRIDEARATVSEAALLCSQTGNRRALTYCVKELGHIACAGQDYAAALRLLALSETLRRAMGISFRPADPMEITRDIAMLQEKMGRIEFDAAWATVDSLPINQAFSESLRLAGLGDEGETFS